MKTELTESFEKAHAALKTQEHDEATAFVVFVFDKDACESRLGIGANTRSAAALVAALMQSYGPMLIPMALAIGAELEQRSVSEESDFPEVDILDDLS